MNRVLFFLLAIGVPQLVTPSATTSARSERNELAQKLRDIESTNAAGKQERLTELFAEFDPQDARDTQLDAIAAELTELGVEKARRLSISDAWKRHLVGVNSAMEVMFPNTYRSHRWQSSSSSSSSAAAAAQPTTAATTAAAALPLDFEQIPGSSRAAASAQKMINLVSQDGIKVAIPLAVAQDPRVSQLLAAHAHDPEIHLLFMEGVHLKLSARFLVLMHDFNQKSQQPSDVPRDLTKLAAAMRGKIQKEFYDLSQKFVQLKKSSDQSKEYQEVASKRTQLMKRERSLAVDIMKDMNYLEVDTLLAALAWLYVDFMPRGPMLEQLSQQEKTELKTEFAQIPTDLQYMIFKAMLGKYDFDIAPFFTNQPFVYDVNFLIDYKKIDPILLQMFPNLATNPNELRWTAKNNPEKFNALSTVLNHRLMDWPMKMQRVLYLLRLPGMDVNSLNGDGSSVIDRLLGAMFIKPITDQQSLFLLRAFDGKKVDWNKKDPYEQYPVHKLARLGLPQSLEFILQKGAQVDVLSSSDRVALEFALEGDSTRADFIPTLNVLLRYGPSLVNHASRDGFRPMTVLLLFIVESDLPRSESAMAGYRQAVKLLLQHGAQVDVPEMANVGITPVSLAQEIGDAEIKRSIDEAYQREQAAKRAASTAAAAKGT